MNKQPFYHSAGILFTATEDLDFKEFKDVVVKAVKEAFPSVLADTILVEYFESEAGDPADLM